ncbi:hypothetical protein FIS44_00235 [Escherichia coli]|uniref:hypothetical protein n=1 Tax=Escherichia coli TaxID=562 RepID=UPI00111B653D|nr:hypothetical protein [Escherichia coli]TNH65334.1 hypothetical protein FG869_06370 [Escherichia coli]TPD46418.1 hypothetical protein FIS44_00235 [Escherichia coli]
MKHLYFEIVQTRDRNRFEEGKIYCGVQLHGAPCGDVAMAITGDDDKVYFAYASHINNAAGLYIYRIVHDFREIAVLHAREGSKPE